MNIIEQSVKAEGKAEIKEVHSLIDELKELVRMELQGGCGG